MKFPDLGHQVANYHIKEIIYHGQVSRVYQAVTPAGEAIALKVTDLTGLPDVKGYVAEAVCLQQLHHPQIVTIYDVGYNADYAYLAMELVVGRTLRQQLQSQGAWLAEAAIDIILAVAKALAAVHQQGLIHRDIKPENIMVSNQGQVKLLDFDLAQYLLPTKIGDDPTTTALVGTINYMAAEQILGERVDGRSDLFSLAVVLYEMLTTQTPFAANNVDGLLAQLLRGAMRPLPARFSDDYHQFFQKALAYSPSARYQNALEFQRALQLLRVTESLIDADTLPLQADNETMARIVQNAVDNSATEDS